MPINLRICWSPENISFIFRVFNFVLWHFMGEEEGHKSKEVIKKRLAWQALVLRIRRVEHAIKIPIALGSPTPMCKKGDSYRRRPLFRNVAACKIYC